jgi:hypothetical protein
MQQLWCPKCTQLPMYDYTKLLVTGAGHRKAPHLPKEGPTDLTGIY